MSTSNSNSNLNVLLYSGSGVSASSRDHALANLRSFLSHRYDVQLVSPKSLREDPWTDSCALLVFPGGRDLPYQYDLNGRANERIREWVNQGGKYLGFCAGAYYASRRVEFELGTEMEVVGERELGFFPGVCRGTSFPGFAYETEAGAREVLLSLNRTAWRNHWSQSPETAAVWYNGGGSFVMEEEGKKSYPGVEALARYAELPGRPVAGVNCQVGEGRAILWAVHPEHPTFLDRSNSDGEEFAVKEQTRQGLLRATLAMLDLDVSELPAPPPQLCPLFLTSPDLALVSQVTQQIASKAVPLAKDPESPSSPSLELKDRHDHFVLHPTSEANRILNELRLRPGTAEPELLHAATKDIVACTLGVPALEMTPLFDLGAYFRQRGELHAGGGVGDPKFGKLLLYGESVTSTQTMLDKNDRFLSSLPIGLACLASHQIAGRGRGANSWVSPAGCLQFSLVLRLPLAQSRKIVFLQYLFGLAVVEAIRSKEGYEDVGVRLKWPNDVYGDVGGEGVNKYRKIGGVLVNSSYQGDEFTLVVGCGINTSNPRPTTSVNELIALHNYKTGSSLPLFSQETLLALILAQFEKMWDPFLESGFEPFLDQYLERWIHSDQRVTIQASSQVVRIVGITPDHGLLRTIPVDVDRNGKEVYGMGGAGGVRAFVDLQPDGNGFDMIQGLLVSRS